MQYIDTQSDLDKLSISLQKETKISFDCEFIRETTFVPILCLIQIATTDKIYVIDPLNLKLDSLLKILDNPKILKIMHSCSQDIDVFFKNYNLIPYPIFDTQIAAGFLGLGESISYAKLVKQVIKIKINKDSKLTNWLLRPLEQTQLDYAATDVKYLLNIHKKLSETLLQKNRIDWLEEEFTQLYNIDNYHVHPDDAWKRIPVTSEIPFFLNYLRAFAKIRENLAIKKNRPRRFLIKDDVIIQLANLKPESPSDILKDRILKRTLSSELINEIIAASKKTKLETHSIESSPKKKLSPNKELICDLLKIALKSTAKKYKISPKYIAKTAEIEQFLYNPERIRFLSGWRYEIFGKQAEDIVSGTLKIQIIDGKLQISKR